MKKIKAFTFIELLVVSAILIIISTSSVFYFFGFLDQTKLNTWIDYIKDELKLLDNKIKNKDLLNYEIFFKRNSLFLISYENTLDLDHLFLFSWSVDYYTWSWKLFLNPLWTNTEAVKIDIYANNKFLEDFINPASKKMDYAFSKFKNYRVSSSYSGKILNDIEIKYFAESNTNKTKKDYLKLVKIATDKNSNLDSIYLKNTLWKKSFSDNVNSSKLTLTFDVNWKEKKLEIVK